MKKVTPLFGGGLTVKNGRLINDMPDGMSGIQMAANARQMRKREQKVSMMEEAMVRAEMKSDMNEYLWAVLLGFWLRGFGPFFITQIRHAYVDFFSALFQVGTFKLHYYRYILGTFNFLTIDYVDYRHSYDRKYVNKNEYYQ